MKMVRFRNSLTDSVLRHYLVEHRGDAQQTTNHQLLGKILAFNYNIDVYRKRGVGKHWALKKVSPLVVEKDKIRWENRKSKSTPTNLSTASVANHHTPAVVV